MEWPCTTFEGEPLVHAVRRLGSESLLDEDAVVSLNLKRGQPLVLGPSAAADAPPLASITLAG